MSTPAPLKQAALKHAALKQAARARIDRKATALVDLARRLHADPETAWEEHRAAAAVPALLDRAGFAVTSGYLGLDTAFHATFGSGPTRIALCAEYDALPGLGHACGHNLIAAASVGAALGLAEVADDVGVTVEVYGTPAEEGGGGKIELLDRGAFADVDLAMMVHPAPVDVAEARPFAVSHSHVSYRGRAAHAAAYPEAGVNAADAFTVAQVDRIAAPASPGRSPGARDRHPRWGGPQCCPGAHHRPLVRARGDPGRALRDRTAGASMFRGGRAGHRVRPADRAGKQALCGVSRRRRRPRGLSQQCARARPDVRRCR